MADEQLIKPRELPPAAEVYADDAIMTDDGVTVGKATPGQIVNAGAPVATEAEAIAGVNNVKRMTPLLTKQVLDSVIAPSVLRAEAWAESPVNPNPGIPGSKSAKSWAEEAEKISEIMSQASRQDQYSLTLSDGQTTIDVDADGNQILVGDGVADIYVGSTLLTPGSDYVINQNGSPVLLKEWDSGTLVRVNLIPNYVSPTSKQTASAPSASIRAFASEAYNGISHFDSSPQVDPGVIGERLFTKDGYSFDIVPPGSGDYNQPRTGVGILVNSQSDGLIPTVAASVDDIQGFASLVSRRGGVRVSPGITLESSSTGSYSTVGNVRINGEGAALKFNGVSSVIFTNTPRYTTTMLPSAHGSASITLSDPGAQVGDILEIGSDSIITTDHGGYRMRMVRRVVSVSGSIVTLDTPTRFHVSIGEPGLYVVVYPMATFEISNLNLVFDNSSAGWPIVIRGYSDVKMSGLKIQGPDGIDVSSDGPPRGIQVRACMGVNITNPYCKNMIYPFSISDGTRNTVVIAPIGERCRHIIDPAVWADGVTIVGQRASDCWQSINTHPAFDVNYYDSSGVNEIIPPNLRAIGGVVRGCSSSVSDAGTPPTDAFLVAPFPISTGYEYLWDSARFEIEARVTRGGVPWSILRMYRGFCNVSNTDAGRLEALNTVEKLQVGSGNNIGISKFTSASSGVRTRLNRSDNPRVDAKLNSGVHEIDLTNNMPDQSERVVKVYGQILSDFSSAPFQVRIMTNVHGYRDQVPRVIGLLTLRTYVKHSSSGNFDFVEQKFAFRHQIVSTSSVDMPLTSWLSTTSQSPGPKVSVAISDISQQGQSQVGANAIDYIQFTATPSISATSPIIGVTYELELVAFDL